MLRILYTGCDPDHRPAIGNRPVEVADTGYIVFENGVKAVYLGGHKNTPANVKMTLEVVGSKGRVIVDNAGDGRNEKGEWTGTYTATATMYDERHK